MSIEDCRPRPRNVRGGGLEVSAAWLVLLVYGAGAAAQNSQQAELRSQDSQPTFKVQVQRNLVLVRVVVRDPRGSPVGNLRQLDFRLFDNGKPQAITYFSVENAAAKAAANVKPEPRVVAPEAEPADSTPAFTPLRYLALFFDDVHADFEGLAHTRDAAQRYLAGAAHSGDRIGVFTSSGQGIVDFTEDLSKIQEALLRLRPRPIVPAEMNPCPDIFPYQAYLIVDRREQHALEEVAEEILSCRYNGDRRYYDRALNDAEAEAVRNLTRDANQSSYSFRELEQLVRRMAALPGQRNIVMVSPGFFAETERLTTAEIVDRALRAKVIVNALDCKGLFAYVPIAGADKEGRVVVARPDLTGKKAQDQIDSFRYDQDVMAQLATETGGVFFTNSNDFDEGFRRVGALPQMAYVLGFSPQGLKLDGHFHTLKVTLNQAARLTVQARRGYFAPRKAEDPAEQQKADIEEAVFSQDELNGLPVDVHTQFFRVNDHAIRLSVVAHMDLRPVRFRKQAGRNVNNLTFVTALFDRDGKYVTAKEKTVEFHLLDNTLDRLSQSGISTRATFEVPPGTYLVREVVRDSEEGQVSGLNRTVELPF